MSYDERCFDLAEHFAGDLSRAEVEELAEHIQGSIECWLQTEPCPHGSRVGCSRCSQVLRALDEIVPPEIGGEG